MKKLLTLSLAALTLAALSARAADDKALYDQTCAKCHGADGKGQTNIGKRLGVKDYTDPKVQEALTDAAAYKAIKEGVKDKDGKVVMRPSQNLSDEAIKGLVAYLRTFKK
ncbi:MAG: cytochrome c [Verrucomicrobiota bacterium]|nr:cytochrome c [Verrucomicrobiota bacterium]